MSLEHRNGWLQARDTQPWHSWSHFMFYGDPWTWTIYENLDDEELVHKMMAVLGHEGAWFGIPRIPEEYRHTAFQDSADDVTYGVALEIVREYNRIPNALPMSEVIQGGLTMVRTACMMKIGRVSKRHTDLDL